MYTTPDLEGVQYYRQLTALDCTGSKVTDISALKHCPALTSLNLTGCRFVVCVCVCYADRETLFVRTARVELAVEREMRGLCRTKQDPKGKVKTGIWRGREGW